MPINDYVSVSVTLSPAAASRPSFGVSALLHTLTAAQDAQFATARSRLLTSSAWQSTLASIGISDGEQAYEAVQAHFGQPNRPEKCYLARRGKDRQQVWTVVVPASPANGVYTIAVNGTPYSFTASGSTQAAVRTALISALGAGAALFTAATGVGAGDITLTAVASGVPLTVLLSSPASSMTASVTTAITVSTIAQVWTLTIAAATLGVYTLTATTTTGQKSYTHIATTGATVTTIRDAIKALYDADPSDLFGATMTSVSTNAGTLTASVAGRPGTVTLACPTSAATLAITTANWGIADDIAALNAQNTDWYALLVGTRTDADLLLAAEQVEGMRRICGVQSSTAAIKAVTTTDAFARMKSLARLRTYGVYHPIDAEGVMEGWAGDVMTTKAGGVTWKGRPLTGLTGNAFADPAESANILGKEGSYLENFPSLNKQVMNGGYTFSGRPIDIVRALDTFTSNCEISLLELMTNNRIVPYTNEGVTQARGVIQAEFDNAIGEGYAVPGSLVLSTPSLTAATPEQRQRGQIPVFTGSATFQAGTHKITLAFTVNQ